MTVPEDRLAGYLDWASTAPLHPAAAAVLAPAMESGWADPARLYGPARRARAALDAAREQIAGLLGARADEVSFPTSGTAAVHAALLGALIGRRRVGDGLVHSAVEHSCVLNTAAAAASQGRATPISVGVDRLGRVDRAAFIAAVSAPGIAVASLQSANHEVGTVQPVTEVAAGCAAAGVPLHVDAAQTVGRMELPTGWSLLTASAHKWGGPPGVGVLVVRTGTRWASPWPEDERGGGRAPGFENVPGVLAAAAALAAVEHERAAEATRLAALVARLRVTLPTLVPDIEVMGDPAAGGALPHLVTFSCLYVAGEALLLELDRAGVCVSSGSSCTSSALTPSHVLVAMGALTHGNIRVSLGRTSTAADVDQLLAVLPAIVARLRDDAGAGHL